jgi:hypothetical protein
MLFIMRLLVALLSLGRSRAWKAPPADSIQANQVDAMTAIDDDVRAIVERNWPRLIPKLPPRDE